MRKYYEHLKKRQIHYSDCLRMDASSLKATRGTQDLILGLVLIKSLLLNQQCKYILN